MSAEELIVAIREDQVKRVLQLLFTPEPNQAHSPRSLPINQIITVTGESGTLYPSHALFEACLGGNLEIINAILKREDVDLNLPATHEEITSLAEACKRGKEYIVERLLKDERIDPQAGSKNIRLPLQYAIMEDRLYIVKLFSKYGFVDFASESLLLATSQEYQKTEIESWLSRYYLSLRSLSELSPEYKVRKIWQEFCKFDFDGNGYIDKSELRILASALGTPLSEPELSEAQIALDTNGDGRVDFEELVTFWLAEDEPSDELEIIEEEEHMAGEKSQSRSPPSLSASKENVGGIHPDVMRAVQEITVASPPPAAEQGSHK